MNKLIENKNLWRQIIIDHCSKPRTKVVEISKEFTTLLQSSNTCIDNFTLGILVKSNGEINKLVFKGVGCAVSTSAIDIMNLELLGKKIKVAKKIIENYLNLIYEKLPVNNKMLGNMVVFSNVSKQPSRIKCATIGINGIYKLICAILDENKGVSYEAI